MSAAMGDTFLTQPLVMDLPEPEGMTRVREEHSRLQGVVFSLNKKISQVLAKQEGDFLAAYRAHMYTVQKELQTLRQRVIEAENVLQKNDKVQKLEDECDWYRKEALRLDSFNTAMKKDLKYMKEKLEILEDDRNWLARQLKACKKQDKVLRAELGLRAEAGQDQGRSISADIGGKGASSMMENSQSQPLLSGAMGSLDRIHRHKQSMSSPGLSPFGYERQNLRTAPDHQGRHQSQRYEDALVKKVRTLERKLAKEQRETMRVRATRARDAVERSEMEDFFMQCVEDVKREIEQRKIRQRSHRSVTLRSASADARGKPSCLPSSEPSKTTLQQFTANDRRAVVESLLQREDVVTHLFNMCFPAAIPARRADSAASKE